MTSDAYVAVFLAALVLCVPVASAYATAEPGTTQSDRVKWTVNVNDESVGDLLVTPERVFVASGSTLYAVDRETQTIAWSTSVDLSTLDQINNIHLAGDYLIGVDDNIGDDVLYVVDSETGDRSYTKEVDEMVGVAAGDEQMLYTVASQSISEDCLQARNPSTGLQEWEFCRSDMTAVTATSDRVYLTGASETVALRKSDQQPLWAGQGSVALAPFLLPNRVYVYSGTDRINNEFTPHFIGYDRETGTREAAFEVPYQSFEISYATRAADRVVLNTGTRFDATNTLAVYNLTAAEHVTTRTVSTPTAALDGADEYVYRASLNGTLYAYSATDLGDEFSVQLGGAEPTALVATDTAVFAGDRSGNLVAIEPPGDPGAFEVGEIDAPANATQGTTVTVSATVRNVGEERGTKPVAFRVDTDGDGTLETRATRNVSLVQGESRTVSFALDTTDLATGTYTHGVFVDDRGETATLQVTDPRTAGVTVELRPSEHTVATDGNATFDVVARGVDAGVGGYDLVVNSSNVSRAVIADVTDRTNGTSQRMAASDGSGMRIATFGGNTSDSGPVTVATVTATGVGNGTVQLPLRVVSASDERGLQYSVDATSGATLTVRATEIVPVVRDRVPTDPDGDGQYEDLNGDGATTPGDATVLFNAVFSDDPAVTENVAAYDFNEDGSVTPGDATVLFDELF